VRQYILRPFVLGSIDGIITSFVVIAGGLAADVQKSAVIVIGISSLVADGFSMGVSEFLSSRTNTTTYNAAIMGTVCLVSFVSFGSVPLIGYTIAGNDASEAIVSGVAFILSLLVVAILRAHIAQEYIVRSVSEVLILGSCAAGIAYGVASIKST
jgi:VIT1/CCC1 family predicted Fe2+/Mn2+ transporter